MQRIKQIASIASIISILFLFLCSVSVLASSKIYFQGLEVSVSKSGKQPVSPDTQSPFEENQGETGDEFQDGASPVCLLEETLSINSIVDQCDFVPLPPKAEDISGHVPIYLAKKSLLI